MFILTVFSIDSRNATETKRKSNDGNEILLFLTGPTSATSVKQLRQQRQNF
jgi:hypothetical protein